MINIQNTDDNEWFKWCLVRYLHPVDLNLRRITKDAKDFEKRVNSKDIKFPVKTRDILEIEKNNSICISVFGYENKEKNPIYVSNKCCEEKHVDSLLIGEEGKRHYVVIKDFSTFMYDHTLQRGGKVTKIALKLIVSKGLKDQEKLNTLNSKILKEK